MDDLVECNLRSDVDLVATLRTLFEEKKYFAEIGDILVSVNPWQTNIATDYINVQPNGHAPHPYTVAERVIRNGFNAVVIPLGESGSGKSWNIQTILKYLPLRLNSERVSQDDMNGIIKVLHLFCNAKTLICNSSTRCMKIYEVFFDSKSNQLLRVNVQIHCLEKLRVVGQIQGEGNFTIFHEVLNTLGPYELQEYLLDGNQHRYLSSFHHDFTEGKSLAQSLYCLRQIGLSEKETFDVCHILFAIILLGDLRFGESSKRDVIAFRNGEVLAKAASLFGIPCATLAELIIQKSKTIKGEKLKISLLCSQAIYECDRIAVICYDTLVKWLEARINATFSQNSGLQSDFSLRLFDVFGWENYSVCSYEQLCINTVNEALQSTYNAIVFTAFEENLKNENIFLNESCVGYDVPGALPLLLKPKGLLDQLHCSSIHTSEQNLLKKLNHCLKNEPRYIANNQGNAGFLIEHFIGEVSYDVRGLVTRSKNGWNEHILMNLRASDNAVVSNMVEQRMTRESFLQKAINAQISSSKKSSFVEKEWLKTNTFLAESGKEKTSYESLRNSNPAALMFSLTSILKQVTTCQVYFIRCINSNLEMKPFCFDDERVLRQIQYGKLDATLKTRLPCLKVSYSMSEFIRRYQLIFLQLFRNPSREQCYLVLSRLFHPAFYKVALTKVFLSKDSALQLDELLQKALQQLIVVQKVSRGALARKKHQRMKNIKMKYDKESSIFLCQISQGISDFHDHLSLQISDDERRLKQNKLTNEQMKQVEITTPDNRRTSCSPGSYGRQTSYTLGSELITDETSKSLGWCKIGCFQRDKQLALFTVKDSTITIDGSNHIFTTDRIGFNSFPTPCDDKQMKKVKSCIGRGVQLFLSDDGSLMAVRLCKNPIFVKGHFCERKLIQSIGELPRNEASKLFDYNVFVEKINYECHPARVNNDTQENCLSLCFVHLCFVRNSETDEETPCWVMVELSQAVDYYKDLLSFSMQKRREIQEKYHFQQPPALKIDSRIESTSAKILKLIRPARYIETMKFQRRAWARKRVVSNPFLYEGSSGDNVCNISTHSSESNDDDGVFQDHSSLPSPSNITQRNASIETSDIVAHHRSPSTSQYRGSDIFLERSQGTKYESRGLEETFELQVFDEPRDISENLEWKGNYKNEGKNYEDENNLYEKPEEKLDIYENLAEETEKSLTLCSRLEEENNNLSPGTSEKDYNICDKISEIDLSSSNRGVNAMENNEMIKVQDNSPTEGSMPAENHGFLNDENLPCPDYPDDDDFLYMNYFKDGDMFGQNQQHSQYLYENVSLTN